MTGKDIQKRKIFAVHICKSCYMKKMDHIRRLVRMGQWYRHTSHLLIMLPKDRESVTCSCSCLHTIPDMVECISTNNETK